MIKERINLRAAIDDAEVVDPEVWHEFLRDEQRALEQSIADQQVVDPAVWEDFLAEQQVALDDALSNRGQFSRVWENFASSASSEATNAVLSGDYSNIGSAIARIFAQIFLQAAIQAGVNRLLSGLGLISGAPTAHEGTRVPAGPDRLYRLEQHETVRTVAQERAVQMQLEGRTGGGDFIFSPTCLLYTSDAADE